MLRKVIFCILLSSTAVIAHTPSTGISLTPKLKKEKEDLGHIYVFSKALQTVNLTFPSSTPVTAQLYRTAGTILTPVASPIKISPEANQPIPITIDFPPSNKPTQYTLVFNTTNKPCLNITAIPSDVLVALQQATQKKPLTLVNPPKGFSNILRQFSISSRIQNNPHPSTEEMLIIFKTNNSPMIRTQAKRIITVLATDHTNKEIWVQKEKERWEITIPSSALTPETLLTAKGQQFFKTLLLGTPDSH